MNEVARRPATELEARAEDLLMRIARVVVLGGELEGLLIQWRRDLWAMTLEKE